MTLLAFYTALSNLTDFTCFIIWETFPELKRVLKMDFMIILALKCFWETRPRICANAILA